MTSDETIQSPDQPRWPSLRPSPPVAMITFSLLAVFVLSSPTTNDQLSHYNPGYLTMVLTNGWLDHSCCDADEGFVGPLQPLLLANTQNDAAETEAEQFASVEVKTEQTSEQHGQHIKLANLPFDPLSEPSFSNPPASSPLVRSLASPHAEETDSSTVQLASSPQLQTVEGLREVNHRIRAGETISHVLDSAGVSPAEVRTWLSAANRVYNLDRVYAGQEVSFVVDTSSHSLEQLSLEIDRKSLLVANRRDGRIVAERREVPNFRRIRVASGEIASSLYMAALTEGIPDAIISAMAEILGWDIDFARDVQPGATFRVAYEELVRLDTHESIPGRVLAIEMTNRNRKLEGIYFTPHNGGPGGYFDRNGRALGRAFLRYPVEFSRISSQFSTTRLHPIKKIALPHYGVDFAAPTGTPVVASAAGEVLIASWTGGNGRFVKIRHDDAYQSAYAHLSRIAPGIVEGARVRKGQVIGNVGSTGMATGPHLHYAMYKFGRYIDPLSAELPRERALSAGPLKAFEIVLGLIDATYARAGFSEGAQLAAALPQ